MENFELYCSMCYWTGEGLMVMTMVVMIEILRQSPFNFLNIEKLMKKKMWQTLFFPFSNELFLKLHHWYEKHMFR